MKKKNQKKLCFAVCLLVLFILWTVLLRFIDVEEIGPNGTAVGFATLNGMVHNLTGVHMGLYTVTDWLGLIPIATVLGFAILGLVQWIGRKNLLKVDRDIFILGGFYIIVMAVFIFFECFIVNYRPILIDGRLEASYPSSTTMLSMCVMPTAVIQLHSRMVNGWLKRSVLTVIIVFTAFMVIGRLISGVHWITDIIGGAVFSAGLVILYDALVVTYETC